MNQPNPESLTCAFLFACSPRMADKKHEPRFTAVSDKARATVHTEHAPKSKVKKMMQRDDDVGAITQPSISAMSIRTIAVLLWMWMWTGIGVGKAGCGGIRCV